MTPERRKRAQEVFASAIRRPPETRSAYLDGACEGDAELRREVDSLVASFEAVSSGALESRTIETPPSVMEALVQKAGFGLRAGARLGSYEILERLGAGGMGEVYRARDPKLERHVAVKVLSEALSEDPEALDRFEREARAVAALSHPNILSIFDFGKQDETAYAVTELLEGQTLRERLRAGPLPTEELLGLAAQTLAGLEAAHAKGIIHRDLKPENLFVTKDGRVKILDFGLAKRGAAVGPGEETSAPTATQHTTPGTVMGTLGYISPEQLLGLPADQRSDLFSLGVIIYEMASGSSPFKGKSAVAVADAILHAEPAKLPAGVPPKLEALISRLLTKDPAKRPASAADVRAEIAALVQAPHRGLSRGARIGFVTAAAALLVLGAFLWRRASRERWVHDVAVPDIEKLVEAGENVKAAALLKKARWILPNDPTLGKLWQRATGEISISSSPPGAEVSIRPYGSDTAAREPLGKTPIGKVRVAQGYYVFRVEKEGFAPVEWLDGPPTEGNVTLVTASALPAGMNPVPDCQTGLGSPLADSPSMKLADYFVDRHEVTNDEYKKFVDAGGYAQTEYWKAPFEKDGKTLPFDDALRSFRDSTGRPGPSTWEAGTFAKGLDKHPVAGVSWFEAMAYAAYAGKSLPTIYHWTCAAETPLAALIVPGSNFRATGTRPVGSPSSLSGFGTTDMAGNVKEWCSNEGKEGRRYIMGGGFGEPDYMFQNVDARSPWDRGPNFGFRCVKLAGPPEKEAAVKLVPPFRDFDKEKPVPDEVFRAYRGLYAYDKGELDPRVEAREGSDQWVREKVTFNAAYAGERVIAHIYLPKAGKPPYQTVVFYPGGYAFVSEKFDPSMIDDWEFVLKSGRAFVAPIYRGQFERVDGLKTGGKPPGKWRDRVIMESKDLGRTIDYLETRADIDTRELAYLGFSAGGAIAPMLLANENRFRAAVLRSGGFWFRNPLPEVDWINFVGHVTIPVLMLNGRFDDYFPVESSQLPFFRLLGTPAKDKKHVLYAAGHADLPHKEEVRDTLDWLDKYLGPVKR